MLIITHFNGLKHCYLTLVIQFIKYYYKIQYFFIYLHTAINPNN